MDCRQFVIGDHLVNKLHRAEGIRENTPKFRAVGQYNIGKRR